MGYFDGLVSGSFKKDAQGNSVFYPWGIMGKGYILRTVAEEEKLRGALKLNYMIMLPAIIIIQIAVGAWLNFILVPVYIVLFTLWVYRTTRGLERSFEKITVAESYKSSAKAHNLPTLIILEICAIGFVAIGVWMIVEGEPLFMPVLCILLFGAAALAIGYMIVQKVRG